MGGKGSRALQMDKAQHLSLQAERARQMAVESGSDLVADLYNLHAQLCEQKAAIRQGRRSKPAKFA
jgi:hypothetical protein